MTGMDTRAGRNGPERAGRYCRAGALLCLAALAACSSPKDAAAPDAGDTSSGTGDTPDTSSETAWDSDSETSPESAAWIELSPAGPTPAKRNASAGAYDPETDRLVVFGGRINGPFADDTWVLLNANGLGGQASWIELEPAGPLPAARAEHSAVFDPGSNRLIVFGGQSVDGPESDVWILSGANGTGAGPAWQELAVEGGAPPPRLEHGAAFDAANNRMIVHGGYAPGPTSLNDTWVLSNANGLGGPASWSEVEPVGADLPAPRYYVEATYDAAGSRLLIFQQGEPSGVEVWQLRWQDGPDEPPTWSRAEWSGAEPTRRARPGFLFDAETSRCVVFGGQEEGPIYHAEVWTLDLPAAQPGEAEWRLLAPAGSEPLGRDMPVTGYDAASNRMVAFGGQSGDPDNFLNDVWVLTQANGGGGRR